MRLLMSVLAWVLAWVLASALGFVLTAAVPAFANSSADPASATLSIEPADGGPALTCERAISRPWPATASQRSAYLQTMEGLRASCIDSPGFLAVLGGLLLEDGDPEQALIWLERSLLLDPGNLGAQADHALALAALGEGRALEQLAKAWAVRTDIPPALRARLFPPQLTFARSARLGRTGLPVWGLQREISLLGGYENNLDQSPRLTELTLTAPEGNVTLPVSSQPRRGAALFTSAALQGAYSPEPGTVWRTGLTASTRRTASERPTDWTYVQWAASGLHSWAWWRTHLELGASWVGGPLNEPYRLMRAGLATDVAARSCRLRLGVDAEQRRQLTTASFNALATGVQLGAQCPLLSVAGGAWSLFLRGAQDRPDDDTRPGGVQRQLTAGARLSVPLGPQWQVDLSLRLSEVQDQLGYSVRLKSDAVRWVKQQQINAELSYRPASSILGGAQAVLQLQLVRQASNLPIFEYGAMTIYSGLRWNW